MLYAKHLGFVAPTARGNVWEGRGEDDHFGTYACRFTLRDDGTLEAGVCV